MVFVKSALNQLKGGIILGMVKLKRLLNQNNFTDYSFNSAKVIVSVYTQDLIKFMNILFSIKRLLNR
jgi:hypothetical protein